MVAALHEKRLHRGTAFFIFLFYRLNFLYPLFLTGGKGIVQRSHSRREFGLIFYSIYFYLSKICSIKRVERGGQVEIECVY